MPPWLGRGPASSLSNKQGDSQLRQATGTALLEQPGQLTSKGVPHPHMVIGECLAIASGHARTLPPWVDRMLKLACKESKGTGYIIFPSVAIHLLLHLFFFPMQPRDISANLRHRLCPLQCQRRQSAQQWLWEGVGGWA